MIISVRTTIRLSTILGVLTLILSLVMGAQTLIRWAMGHAADGFTTVIILLLLIGSILMLSLGIIGYYIAELFIEIKGRPRYLLGVPGHYYSNEKYMASMFGFPHFVLAKKQPDEDGRFGYWYTDVRLGN